MKEYVWTIMWLALIRLAEIMINGLIWLLQLVMVLLLLLGIVINLNEPQVSSMLLQSQVGSSICLYVPTSCLNTQDQLIHWGKFNLAYALNPTRFDIPAYRQRAIGSLIYEIDHWHKLYPAFRFLSKTYGSHTLLSDLENEICTQVQCQTLGSRMYNLHPMLFKRLISDGSLPLEACVKYSASKQTPSKMAAYNAARCFASLDELIPSPPSPPYDCIVREDLHTYVLVMILVFVASFFYFGATALWIEICWTFALLVSLWYKEMLKLCE
jgi:hypothetical protein